MRIVNTVSFKLSAFAAAVLITLTAFAPVLVVAAKIAI